MSKALNPVREFIERGYTVVRQAIPQEFAFDWWTPTRRWLEAQSPQALLALGSHLHFPRRRSFSVDEVAPHLATLIRDLLSDAFLAEKPIEWGDGFAVALPGGANSPAAPTNWHKDGFFRHYLDSQQVGLVCLVLWTDATEENGATVLAEGSVSEVANLLRNRPEGVHPDEFESLLRSDWPKTYAVGQPGDVYLLHPFLMHARRMNRSSQLRAITNPALSLERRLSFSGDRSKMSAVEEAILNAIGGDTFKFVRSEISEEIEPTLYSNELSRQRTKLLDWLTSSDRLGPN